MKNNKVDKSIKFLNGNENIANLVFYLFLKDYLSDKEKQQLFLPEASTSKIITAENKEIINKESKENEVPIFFDAAFYLKRINLLYADSNVGKSQLSEEIGMSNHFKKCLFIVIDNKREKDNCLYEKMGDKTIIINYEKIKILLEKMVSDLEIASIIESSFLYEYSKNNKYEYTYAENIFMKCYKNNGIKLDNKKPVEKIDVIEEIMLYAINNCGVDFICIDSINSLFDDPRRINRKSINRITQTAIDKNITLLCLHHTNGSGEMAGQNCIKEEFEYVYKLTVDTSIPINENGKRILLLDEEKARNTAQHSIRFMRTFHGSDITARYELMDIYDYYEQKASTQKRKSLYTTIKGIIDNWNLEYISLSDLTEKLDVIKPIKKGSILNYLKRLSDDGIIKMANDKTWENIEIIRD